MEEIKKIQSPEKQAKVEQIETWIGEDITEENSKGGRAKLTMNHYCGDDNEALIEQLKVMIYGLENGFEAFAVQIKSFIILFNFYS